MRPAAATLWRRRANKFEHQRNGLEEVLSAILERDGEDVTLPADLKERAEAILEYVNSATPTTDPDFEDEVGP